MNKFTIYLSSEIYLRAMKTALQYAQFPAAK